MKDKFIHAGLYQHILLIKGWDARLGAIYMPNQCELQVKTLPY